MQITGSTFPSLTAGTAGTRGTAGSCIASRDNHIESGDCAVPKSGFDVENDGAAGSPISAASPISSVAGLSTWCAVVAADTAIPRIPVALCSLMSMRTLRTCRPGRAFDTVFADIFDSEACSRQEGSLQND